MFLYFLSCCFIVSASGTEVGQSDLVSGLWSEFMPGKTCLWNALLHIKWYIEPYVLTYWRLTLVWLCRIQVLQMLKLQQQRELSELDRSRDVITAQSEQLLAKFHKTCDRQKTIVSRYLCTLHSYICLILFDENVQTCAVVYSGMSCKFEAVHTTSLCVSVCLLTRVLEINGWA